MNLFRAIAIAFLLSSAVSAQEFITVSEAEATTTTRIETTTVTEGVGASVALGPVSDESTATVTVITESDSILDNFGPPSIEFEDALTGIDASEAFEQISGERIWIGRKSGRYRIRASAVNRDTFAIRTQKLIVEVRGAEPSIDVGNVYGVGAVAYSATAKKNELLAVSQIYRDAADMLYGNPQLLIIAPSSDPRSVFRWIRDRTSEHGGDWSPWRAKLDEAFRASQLARQYSREDWYAALNEVSQALEARAK